MINKDNEQQNVMLQTMKDVQDFFEDFKSVNELWKVAARAGAEIAYLQVKCDPDDLQHIVKMLDYFEMMLQLMEPMSKKGGEV